MNGRCRRIVKLLKALLVIVVSDKMPVQAFEPTTLAILPYGQAVMEVLSYQASFADKC